MPTLKKTPDSLIQARAGHLFAMHTVHQAVGLVQQSHAGMFVLERARVFIDFIVWPTIDMVVGMCLASL